MVGTLPFGEESPPLPYYGPAGRTTLSSVQEIYMDYSRGAVSRQDVT